MAQTLTQLTIAWLIATIEAKRAGLAGSLAQTPVADWGAAPVRDVRNHEQDLHTAMQVLGDMLNQRGAFADLGVPAAPHLERVPAYVCGVDLSAEGLADLKKALADPRRRTYIERMPVPALDANAIAANVCQRVAELPDRNSPEDWPEAMLVTGPELIDVVTCEITEALAAAAAPELAALSQAARDVLAERRRQDEVEGWSPGHDDGYRDGELSLAASSYACAAANLDDAARDFPWPKAWWKPSTPRRNLEKAGALIIAEMERLDRAAAKSAAKGA